MAPGIEHSLPLLSRAQQTTFIFDAETDAKDIWQMMVDLPTDVLIRLSTNRWVKAGSAEAIEEPKVKLKPYIHSMPLSDTYHLKIRGLKRRNYSRNKSQNRKGRTAEMEVRFAPVKLAEAAAADPPLYVVEAKENPTTVPSGEEPIHWILLTTHPVDSPEMAKQIIDWYKLRWMIEQVFRVSKRKGFNIEAAELAYFDSILKQTVATMEAAFRVMTLVMARDKADDQTVEQGFTQTEILCLQALNQKYQGRTQKQKNPHPSSQLSWAAWIIARLGGWKGLPSRRPPGPIIMKRGLDRFSAIFEGYIIQDEKYLC